MRRNAYLVFVILALSATLAGLSSIHSLVPTVPRAHGVNRTISLVGNFNGWNFSLPSGQNPTITVTEGDIVTISLTSVDSTHQFALDVDKDGAKITGACSTGDTCSALFAPSTPTSVMIDTSSLSGSYTYFCTFHSVMIGSFIVNAVSTVGGTVVPIDRLALVTPYILLSALSIGLIFVAVYMRSRHEKRSAPL